MRLYIGNIKLVNKHKFNTLLGCDKIQKYCSHTLIVLYTINCITLSENPFNAN